MVKNKKQDRTRLREILSVVRKRKLHKGLTPEKLRLIFEDLGPTFIKLGQIASTREDILPPAFCHELAKLQTRAAPVPASEIRSIIESNCKASMASLFASFEETPVGTASIAQVHNAVLKNGHRVVVKVQRPGIYEIMEKDINLLLRAAGFINWTKVAGEIIDFKMVLREMWQVTQQEMDFDTEAANLREFAKRNRDIAYVACPKVYPACSNKYVLVMERIAGIAIDDIDALKKQGYDIQELSLKLTENYIKQVLDDAFFHADPHPGNIIIRGGKIVWIDMGMMGRLNERDRSLIKKAMTAVIEQDIITVKEALLSLGVHTGRINHPRLYADIENYLSRYASMSLQDITGVNLSEMLNELVEMAKSHGISMPGGVTMLGRGMLIFESLLLRLNPELDLITVMASHLSAPFLQSLDIEKLLSESGRALLGSVKKGIHVPAQLSDLLRMTMKGQTKLNYEHSGSEEWNRHIAGQVNKLALTLLACALIIGSSILCILPLEPALFGMPVAALVGFALAGVFIVRLLFEMKRK